MLVYFATFEYDARSIQSESCQFIRGEVSSERWWQRQAPNTGSMFPWLFFCFSFDVFLECCICLISSPVRDAETSVALLAEGVAQNLAFGWDSGCWSRGVFARGDCRWCTAVKMGKFAVSIVFVLFLECPRRDNFALRVRMKPLLFPILLVLQCVALTLACLSS